MAIKTIGKNRDQFVVCIDNSGYPASLELNKIYRVIPDADSALNGDLRVVDESGEDYLYSTARFVPVELPGIVKQSFLKSAPGPRTARSANNKARGKRGKRTA